MNPLLPPHAKICSYFRQGSTLSTTINHDLYGRKQPEQYDMRCIVYIFPFIVIASCGGNVTKRNNDTLATITHRPGAHFGNGILPAIQIRWKIRLAVIPLLVIKSQQFFAHAMTAELSCHVKNFVAVTLAESRWEWKELFIEFELQWKNR